MRISIGRFDFLLRFDFPALMTKNKRKRKENSNDRKAAKAPGKI